MTQLNINLPGGGYSINIGAGLLINNPRSLLELIKSGRAAVVSDENVWGLYSEMMSGLLSGGGIDFMTVILPAGEQSKSISNFERLLREFAGWGLRRGDCVITFGGGVVGDIAGFASASYMRGVDFIQVPTTLLAQVDSSVGGKVAVNLPEGKNLIGAFHQPTGVIADISLLATLPERELKAGMAETAKYALIQSEELYRHLMEGKGYSDLETTVFLSCKSKAYFVERDERESGIRAFLNFGHTFAHALETRYSYRKYNHGEAVSVGMRLAAQFGAKAGVTGKDTEKKVLCVLEKMDLCTKTGDFLPDCTPLMLKDKKNSGTGISLVLLKELFSPIVHKTTPDEITKAAALQSPGLAVLPGARNVTVRLPSSKSVTHRAIICAALSKGESVLRGVSPGDDIEATIGCMEKMGANIYREGDNLTVGGGLSAASEPLFCNESGSTLRFLIPVAALFPGKTVFTGRGRLLNRPLEPILDTLKQNGAISGLTQDALTLTGGIKSGTYTLPGDLSSQFVSGLLLALPMLDGDSEIILTTPLESASYVDITLDVMEKFGVKVSKTEKGYFVPGGQCFKNIDMTLEADYSQAAFFLIAGALAGPVTVTGLDPESSQGDKRIISILKQAGAIIHVCKETGAVTAAPGDFLYCPEIDVSDIPDLAPPLAVLLSFCSGGGKLTGAARLRYKESDRLNSTAATLNTIGGSVRVNGSSLQIDEIDSFYGGRVNACGDHRIAMTAALASVKASGAVYIEGHRCVNKSYPRFFEDFGGILI